MNSSQVSARELNTKHLTVDAAPPPWFLCHGCYSDVRLYSIVGIVSGSEFLLAFAVVAQLLLTMPQFQNVLQIVFVHVSIRLSNRGIHYSAHRVILHK